MRRSGRQLLALAVGLALAGACHHEPRVTACGLLTAQDIQRATGGTTAVPRPVVQSSDDSEAGRSFCLWLRSGELPPEGTFIGLIQNGEMAGAVRRTGFSASAVYSAAKAKATQVDEVTVPGSSAEAFWADNRLNLLAGDAYLSVTVEPSDGGAARSIATQLARAALARLPR